MFAGHLEAGETELQAAYRETEEEAGFSKDQLTVWEGFEKTLYYEVKGKLKKVHCLCLPNTYATST